jgi:hypothetical protein
MKLQLAAAAVLLLATTRASADERPKTMEYVEGQPPPPGYHVEERRRKGLIIGGAIMTGTVWMVTGIVSALDRRRDVKTYGPIPIVGPFIVAGTGALKDNELAIFVGSGLLQLGGVVMLTLGIVTKKVVLVRDTVAIVPMATPDTLGLGATASF